MMNIHMKALVFGAAGAGGAAVLIGLPTDLIPNPWFVRMMEARPHDYLFFVLTVIMAGALCATYAYPASCPRFEGRFAAGGLLSFLAVGCPICNQLVVLALGTSGAMMWFAPVQPVMAVAALGLLSVAFVMRLRAIRPPAPFTPQATEVHR